MNTQTQKALEQPSVAQLNNEYLRDTHVDGLEQQAPSWQGLDEDEFIYFTHWVDADTLAEIEQTLKEKNT